MNRSARRRRRHGGGGHDERWLITYADMITVLLALFICMYAISAVSLVKFDELATSLRSGFGGDLDGMGGSTQLGIPSEGAQVLPDVFPAGSFELMSIVADRVRGGMSAEDADGVEFLSDGGVVKVRVTADDVLFPRGSADLSPRARRTLDAIARAVAPLPHDVRVEGHTCDLPIRTPHFPSNWELSSQRAINVILYLVRTRGWPPSRLSAVGYADTVPVAPNTSEKNRAANRRIDIVLVSRGPGAASSRREVRVPPRPDPPGVAPAPIRLDPALDAEAVRPPSPGGRQ